MKLRTPYLAKCSDRSILPRSHPLGYGPSKWFSSTELSKVGLTGITFDFFVNWANNPLSISTIFWKKALVLNGYTYKDILQTLLLELNKLYPSNKLEAYVRLADKYSVVPEVLIFPDTSDWSDNTRQILRVGLSFKQGRITTTHRIEPLSDIKNAIKKYSGGPIRIGSKGLMYGTSGLECELSRTDSLYPGDADMVLVDNNFLPKCILEFKKHNLDTPITNQTLSNYYPLPDRRKYDRLATLRDFFEMNVSNVPIFVIYYSTKQNHKKGKIELVDGRVGQLKSSNNILFDPSVSGGKDSALDCILRMTP